MPDCLSSCIQILCSCHMQGSILHCACFLHILPQSVWQLHLIICRSKSVKWWSVWHHGAVLGHISVLSRHTWHHWDSCPSLEGTSRMISQGACCDTSCIIPDQPAWSWRSKHDGRLPKNIKMCCCVLRLHVMQLLVSHCSHPIFCDIGLELVQLYSYIPVCDFNPEIGLLFFPGVMAAIIPILWKVPLPSRVLMLWSTLSAIYWTNWDVKLGMFVPWDSTEFLSNWWYIRIGGTLHLQHVDHEHAKFLLAHYLPRYHLFHDTPPELCPSLQPSWVEQHHNSSFFQKNFWIPTEEKVSAEIDCIFLLT